MADAAINPTDLPAPSAERRQVTALFADMVGFTAISERLGEEGTFALIQPIYELMARAVKDQGGSVKDFTGDGIMALFGVPDALEDGPLRACRAGLAIQERLIAATPQIEAKHGLRPEMRIGLNSGLAVVTQIRGEGGSATALGDTVNLASRLQTLAEPGTVYLSEATHRLVEGLVETTFAGTHAIKGKAEPQKVYRLNGLRRGATRFEAAVGRGLSAYVGRERELDVLRRALADSRTELQVIDVVAEAGMGKSRLVYEFRQRIGKEQMFILLGRCSPDGRQTPFLPFIDVVRGSFQVKAGEAEAEIARKLETGLTEVGLSSLENLGLLLNLLSLKPPEGALTGLDGVLIGLRTRDLIQTLLEAYCRRSPVALLMEDLHWIDSVSEELLGKIGGGETKLRLLLLHTRRPEYEPPWLSRHVVTKLHLEPLPTGEIRRLIQARLGVEVLPEALVRLVTEKADGNALFAEEIVSFLAEQGVLRANAGKAEFDASAVAAALPTSVQSLLTARVDRLAPQDRALLQAAAVIGRRFDPQLVAVAADCGGDIDPRLAAMEALDLIYAEGKSGDYVFKHALSRDALYQSLLTGPRVTLHLKVAEEIERRAANRLPEVAETLAHHYTQTDRADKAFTYMAMSGAKSLGIYSLDEAATYFRAAFSLLDENPKCATDVQVLDSLVHFASLLNMRMETNTEIALTQKYLTRLENIPRSAQSVRLRHYYVVALLWNSRYEQATLVQRQTMLIAEQLGDVWSIACSLAGEILVSSVVAPRKAVDLEPIVERAVKAASETNDAYLQYLIRYVIAFEEMHCGRMEKARTSAQELMQIGRRLGDPRATGLGLSLLALIALPSDCYTEALEYAEQAIAVAITPVDREAAVMIKGCALVLLRRVEEGKKILEQFRSRRLSDGTLHTLTMVDGAHSVARILEGKLGEGVRSLKKLIKSREGEGYVAIADWYRQLLSEVYLTVIEGRERPPFSVILKNLPVLLKIIIAGPAEIENLLAPVRANLPYDLNGYAIGRCEMTLGLLYKAKKKGALAVQHLTEARRIASQFGPTPMLTKIEAALAELT